jgi:hypothetical protein
MSLSGGQSFGMNTPLGQVINNVTGIGPPSSPSRMFSGGSGVDTGGTSSPFNPSPSTVAQPASSSSASMAHIEQIRQVGRQKAEAG